MYVYNGRYCESLDHILYYNGEIKTDNYGRKVPKHAHGTDHTSRQTSSAKLIMDATLKLNDEIVPAGTILSYLI